MPKMIQATKDKLIAKIVKQDDKTSGGIIIPDSAVNEPQLYAGVVSIGNDVKEIDVGDTILCHRSGGMDIMMEGQIYKVLKDDEVYGVLKE